MEDLRDILNRPHMMLSKGAFYPEGIRYCYDDNEFIIVALYDSGAAGLDTSLTVKEAERMRDDLDKWIKMKKGG